MALTFFGAHWLGVVAPIIPRFPFTLTTWVRMGVQPGAALLSWGVPGGAEYHALTTTVDGRYFQTESKSGGISHEATSPVAFTPDVWTHVAGQFISATERHVFQNGVRMDLSSEPVPFLGSELALGHRAATAPGPVPPFPLLAGKLGHVAIYGVALTADELLALARGWNPQAIRPTALLAYYPCARTDGTPEGLWLDRWRDRYHLAPHGTGSPTYTEDPPVLARRRHARSILPTVPVLRPTIDLRSPPHLTQDVWPVRLEWAAFGADAFDVYVGPSDPLPLVSANQSAAFLLDPPGVLADGREYAWQVVAKNAVGTTTSARWTFTTLQPPAVVGDPRPRDGAVGIPPGSGIAWAPARYASGYDVWLAEGDEPLRRVSSNQPGTSFNFPSQSTTTYRWRIDARNLVGVTLGPVWTFATADGPAFPVGFTLEAALCGSFRDELITFAHNVATWPIADAIRPGVVAHDISGRNFNGTWLGSGWTFGIPFETFPEGALGTTFTGNGFAEIPSEASPDPTYNLSLRGGDVDIAAVVRGVVLDPTGTPPPGLRCIVSKQDGGPTGNGYHLAIENGRVVLFVKSGGTLIVRLVSQFVLDAGEHVITAHYLTATRTALIFIDGLEDVRATDLSGAELAYTTAPLRIGAFGTATPSDGSGFIGTLGYVSIGREGDTTWGARLHGTRDWTDITADVRAVPAPIELRVGIPGNSPSDRVATTGTLTFPLDNSARRVAIGAYTPGHAHCRKGWRLGIPIRWSILFGPRYYAFHGRLAEVRPVPGIRGPQHVDCTVTDWMDVAAGTPLSALPPQINQRSDQVIAAVLTQSQGRSPISLDLHPGRATFPFSVDGNSVSGASDTNDTMLTELGRVVASEDGFLYIRGDLARGGQLRFEAHAERDQAPVLVRLSNTMSGLDVTYTLQRLINIVRVTYTPRRVDTTIHPLYQLRSNTDRQPIEKGETRVFEGSYVDPANEAERVGGIDLVPLEPNVDYGMNSNPFGTGTNLTSQLAVVATLGGNSFRVEVTNKSGQDAFLVVTPAVSLQVRGKAIYYYQEATEERRDRESARAHGPRVLAITLPYASNPAHAIALAEYYLALYRRPDPIPATVTIIGNRDATHMRYCLALQPGDKIALAEPMTAINLLSTFIVHEKRLTYAAPGIVTASFGLARARPVSTVTPARLGIMRLNAARLNYHLALTRSNPDAA